MWDFFLSTSLTCNDPYNPNNIHFGRYKLFSPTIVIFKIILWSIATHIRFMIFFEHLLHLVYKSFHLSFQSNSTWLEIFSYPLNSFTYQVSSIKVFLESTIWFHLIRIFIEMAPPNELLSCHLDHPPDSILNDKMSQPNMVLIPIACCGNRTRMSHS